MTDIEIIKDDEFTIEHPINLVCRIGTSESGKNLLKSPYMCDFLTEYETLEGTFTKIYRLEDVMNIGINRGVKHRSFISRFKDWVEIAFPFTEPRPICKVYHRDIHCNIKEDR